MSWRRHLKILLGTFLGANAALYLFVLAMNPYGNLPDTLLPRHLIMDDNQRFQYPWIVRAGVYDSLIIGTSTSRLLVPKAFEAMFGGRFANVAMNSGTAWEQAQIADLFLRHAKQPGTLVVGLDYVWCVADADTNRTTVRGFPEWMYDDNRWNDLAYMYNTRSIEIAGRRLAAALWRKAPRLPEDGYEVFTPPENAYDLAKAQAKIYGQEPRQPRPAIVPPDVPTAQERAGWRMPALGWLDQLLAAGRLRNALLVWPPVHAIAQPTPGTTAAAREAECKARVARIAARHGTPVIDFRIHSGITMVDTNYWDHLHYRVGIADRVQADIAKALATRADDPAGDWTLPAAVAVADPEPGRELPDPGVGNR